MSNAKTVTETIVDVEATEVKKPKRKVAAKKKTTTKKTTLRSKDEILSEINAVADKPKINIPAADKKSKMLSTIVDGQADLDLSHFDEKEKGELIAIGKKLNVHDISTVTNFGSELQKAMNDTSKDLLSHSRMSKIGNETETILNEMMSQISEIDIDELKPMGSIERFLRKIPIIKKFFNTYEKFMSKYDNLEDKVEKCEANLHAVSIKADGDNKMLQGQFDDINDYIEILEKFIIAGKAKSNELQVVVDEMDAHSDEYTPIQIADVKDFKHNLDLRLTNMLTWRTTFQQSLYRIREIQKANVAQSNNVRQTIDNMMPMLRQQLTEAVAIYNLQQGAKVVDAVQKGFNDILAHNADMVHDAVVAIREQTENPAIRLETLRHNQERLIATMRDAQKAADEGMRKRAELERELVKMNVELNDIVSGTEHKTVASRPSAKYIEDKYLKQ